MIPYDEPPENALPVPIIVQEKPACSQYTKNRCLLTPVRLLTKSVWIRFSVFLSPYDSTFSWRATCQALPSGEPVSAGIHSRAMSLKRSVLCPRPARSPVRSGQAQLPCRAQVERSMESEGEPTQPDTTRPLCQQSHRCFFDTGERKIRLHSELLIQGRQIHQHEMRIFLSSDLDAGEIGNTRSISRF
jgi:hypothetical protein